MLLLTVRVVHLIAASVWVGGLFTLAALVIALRRAGVGRDVLRAAARAFGWLSWSAMAIAVATGVAQVQLLGLPWSYGRLHTKLGMVGLAILLAAVHTLTARRTGDRVRRVLQAGILLVSIGIIVAAVWL